MPKERLMMTRPVWWQNEKFQVSSIGANLLADASGQVDGYDNNVKPVLDAINQNISGDMTTYMFMNGSFISENAVYKFRTEQPNYYNSDNYTSSEVVFMDIHMSGANVHPIWSGENSLSTLLEGDTVTNKDDKILRYRMERSTAPPSPYPELRKFRPDKYDYMGVFAPTDTRIYAIEIYASGNDVVQNGIDNPTATDKYYYPSTVSMTQGTGGDFNIDWFDDAGQPAWAFGAPKLAYAPTDLNANDEWIRPRTNVYDTASWVRSEGEAWSWSKYPTTTYPTVNDPDTEALILNYDLSSETDIDDIDPISRMTLGINIQPSSVAAHPDEFEVVVENNIGEVIGYGIGGICSGDAWETHNVEIGTVGGDKTFADFKYPKFYIKNVPVAAKFSTAEFYMEMGKGSSGSGVEGGDGGGQVGSSNIPLILGGGVDSPSGARCRDFVDWGNGHNHHRGDQNLTTAFNMGYYRFGQEDESTPQYINPTSGDVMGVVRNITTDSAENSMRNNYYRDGMIEGGGWTSYRNAALIKNNQLIDFDEGFDFTDSYSLFIHSQAYNPANVYAPEENGTILFRGTMDDPELEIYFSDDDLVVTHYDQNGQPVSHRTSVDDSQTMCGIVYNKSGDNATIQTWAGNGYTDMVLSNTMTSFVPKKVTGAKTFLGGVKPGYSEGDPYKGWMHEFGVASGLFDFNNFNAHRFQNYPYLDSVTDVNSINWIIPEMSGNGACWTTKYLLSDLHSMSPPVYEIKNETNPNLIPDTISMTMDVDCYTTHPSGVNIKPQVVFVQGNGNHAVFDLSVTVASGVGQTVTAYPTAFVNVNPLLVSDIDHDYVDLETEFVPYVSGFSGDISIRNATVCMETVEVKPTGDANIPLFVKGLFNSNMDLFIKNDFSGSGVDLFVQGHDDASGNMPLYIAPPYGATKDITLFIPGLEPGSGIEEVTLYVNSTTNPSTLKSMPLSMASVLDPAYAINLYIGTDDGEITSSMDMVVNPSGSTSEGKPTANVDLIAFNNNSGINVNVDMFVKTTEGTAYNDNMNLFINREFNGTSAAVELVMQAPSGENESITLYVDGVNKINDTLTLMTTGQDTPSGSLQTYVHGF